MQRERVMDLESSSIVQTYLRLTLLSGYSVHLLYLFESIHYLYYMDWHTCRGTGRFRGLICKKNLYLCKCYLFFQKRAWCWGSPPVLTTQKKLCGFDEYLADLFPFPSNCFFKEDIRFRSDVCKMNQRLKQG